MPEEPLNMVLSRVAIASAHLERRLYVLYRCLATKRFGRSDEFVVNAVLPNSLGYFDDQVFCLIIELTNIKSISVSSE